MLYGSSSAIVHCRSALLGCKVGCLHRHQSIDDIGGGIYPLVQWSGVRFVLRIVFLGMRLSFCWLPRALLISFIHFPSLHFPSLHPSSHSLPSFTFYLPFPSLSYLFPPPSFSLPSSVFHPLFSSPFSFPLSSPPLLFHPLSSPLFPPGPKALCGEYCHLLDELQFCPTGIRKNIYQELNATNSMLHSPHCTPTGTEDCLLPPTRLEVNPNIQPTSMCTHTHTRTRTCTRTRTHTHAHAHAHTHTHTHIVDGRVHGLCT